MAKTKKKVVRKKIKDQAARQSQAYLRRRKREQLAAAKQRKTARERGRKVRGKK